MFRVVLRNHPFNMAAIVIALVTTALSFLHVPIREWVWLAAFAITFVFGAIVRMGPRRAGNIRGLAPALLILSFAALDPLIGGEIAEPVLAWIGVAIALTAVASLSMIEPIADYLGAQAVNLPGVSTLKRMPALKWSAQIAIVATPPLLFALGHFGASGPLWLLLSIVAASATLAVYAVAAVRRRRSHRARAAMPEALAALEPDFVVYWSAPAGTAYQIGMWLPYLKRLDKPFFVMVRGRRSWLEAAELAGSDVPMVLAPRTIDVDEFTVPSLRAAFYVNNATINGLFVRFHQLTHIQLLHGESDKSSSYNPVVGQFDRVYVAGKAGQDRYANHGVNIDQSKFAIVGRPQVESIVQPEVPITERESPVILYAPTWRGLYLNQSYCSLSIGEALFDELLARGCTIIFRLHPWTYKDAELTELAQRLQRKLRDDQATTGRAHVFGEAAETEMTVNDCFNAADAMIADVSSVVGDWLYSLKPLVTTAVGRSPESFEEEFPLARAGYVITEDVATWAPALDEVLGADSRRAEREVLREYYLGSFPASDYASGFLDQARKDIESTEPIGAHFTDIDNEEEGTGKPGARDTGDQNDD